MKLRQELFQAQRETETLKSIASTNASAANIQMQDGPSSIAEQMAGQVDAIRVELEARHDERMQQLEASYNKRIESMKTQLNSKLRDGKEAFRESVKSDHAQALDQLNTQHKEQIQALESRHEREIDELKRNENTKFEQFKKDWNAEHSAAPVTNGNSAIKDESQKEPVKTSWNPSEAEIKDLVANNEIVKTMVKRNIINVLSKEREKLVSQTKEEQQEILNKALAEADKKAKGVTEQAVLMEGKRHGVKLSMTENRARGALAKVEYVEKAATETPQKAVVEVWEIAKNVKPPPVITQQSQQGPPKSQNSPQSTTFVKPSPAISNHNSSQISMFGKPSSTVPSQTSTVQGTFGQPSVVQMQIPPPSGPKGHQQNLNQTDSASSIQVPSSTAKTENTMSSEQIKTSNGSDQSSDQAQPHQKAMENPFQVKQNNNVGTGPATLRSMGALSNLPLPSSGRGASHQFNANQNQSNTGSHPQPGSRGRPSIGRGRGRGSGRGGLPVVATTNAPQPDQGTQASLTGQPLSATAKQFVPHGNKRPRDENQQDGGTDSNGGKRIRGGDQDDGS